MKDKQIPLGNCREDVYIRRTDIPNTKQKKKMYFAKVYELKATLTDL